MPTADATTPGDWPEGPNPITQQPLTSCRLPPMPALDPPTTTPGEGIDEAESRVEPGLRVRVLRVLIEERDELKGRVAELASLVNVWMERSHGYYSQLAAEVARRTAAEADRDEWKRRALDYQEAHAAEAHVADIRRLERDAAVADRDALQSRIHAITEAGIDAGYDIRHGNDRGGLTEVGLIGQLRADRDALVPAAKYGITATRTDIPFPAARAVLDRLNKPEGT